MPSRRAISFRWAISPIGTDVEQSARQVQDRVQRALPRPPEEVRKLGVTTIESSPNDGLNPAARAPQPPAQPRR